MTLGAIAELKVSDPRVLDNPVLHRVPHAMMIERLKLEVEILKEKK